MSFEIFHCRGILHSANASVVLVQVACWGHWSRFGCFSNYAADANIKPKVCKCARLLSPPALNDPKQHLVQFSVGFFFLLIFKHFSFTTIWVSESTPNPPSHWREFCLFELEGVWRMLLQFHEISVISDIIFSSFVLKLLFVLFPDRAG